MALIRLENVFLSFGEFPLLNKVDLQIDPKERIFLIGRNGMGKSCLLKVILGQLNVDGGKIHRTPGLKIAGLSQDLTHFDDEALVYDIVAEGLQDVGTLLKQYHHLTQNPPKEPSQNKWLQDLEDIQKQLDIKEGWQYIQFIENILTRLELPADKKLGTLSGGWQKRVALARALVSKPDLLLLDEPTNHLDLTAIQWLEEYLAQYAGTVLCITHDRALLQKLSKRILELDRGKLTSWTESYDKYLIDKEHRLEIEIKQAKLFDKNLAKEEAWIRQGIKARRTRNEGRVTALKKLREERKLRIDAQGKPTFSTNETVQSGALVVKAEDISYQINNRFLVKDFSIRIIRGDKIALIGPNGIGKSTLLKILLGQLLPQTGTVVLGTNLQIGYFDQLRAGINPELTAVENVAAGRETIVINGVEKHIMSYLSDFLFSPQRSRIPVKLLSGGECNRLLLAKLFSLPTNLLVLDEPTNDLDIESLELLESILVDYKGTLLLVSHDRTFVNEVVTSTLHFAGNGKINEYVGGYDAIPATAFVKKEEVEFQKIEAPITPIKQPTQVITFNSKLKRELEEMPEKIAKLESEKLELQTAIGSSNFYNKEKHTISETLQKFEKIEHSLQHLYKRWEELEKIKNTNI